MKTVVTSFALLCALTSAQSATAQPVAVTADNFIRAETDATFASFVKQGALDRFAKRSCV